METPNAGRAHGRRLVRSQRPSIAAAALTVALCAGALLAGCGQKGPLYLPGEEPASQTPGPFGLDADTAGPADDAAPDDADVTDSGA